MLNIDRWQEITESEILQANIRKYNDRNIVDFYTDFKDAKYSYIEYYVIFGSIMQLLGKSRSEPIRAVDMCGGTGKAAFVVRAIDSGSEVTLVDVAEPMLKIADQKMRESGISNINIVQSDAFSFFEEEGEFDLIIFSSAIHHFKDPVTLLSSAASRLSSGGFIVTIADPTKLIKSKRYRIMEFLNSTTEGKLRVMRNFMKNSFLPSIKEDSVDFTDDFYKIAEYQAYTGMDDKLLSHQLLARGIYPLVHIRYPAGSTLMTKIMPVIGLSWAFSLILQKSIKDNEIELGIELKELISRHMPFRCSFI